MKIKLRLLFGMLLFSVTLTSCTKDSNEPEIHYTVTFNANGGTPTQSQTIKTGETAAAPVSPTKQNYVFLFWHLNGSTTAYNFSTPVNSNITLYAKWEEAAIAEYWQVIWELNGGTWTPEDNHNTQVVKGGTLAEPTAPTKAGKIFDGWYKETALTNKINFPYNVSTITGNFTLYAKWVDPTAEYWNITWELSGGVWSSTDDNHVNKVEKGTTLTEPVAPVKDGSSFDGWYKEAALTNKVTFPATITSDFKLYAKWTTEGEYRMFTSIAEMKTWLGKQADYGTPYKVGLKDINLDKGNNWSDVGKAVSSNKYIYVELKLQACTGTAIPDGNKSGNTTYGVFVDCDNLKSIHLPEGLKYIGKYAFYHCDKLVSVSLPKGVKSIGELAFGWCVELEAIDFSVGLQYIDNYAFTMCAKLKFASLPAGLLVIGTEAFFGCKSIESIIIPKGITVMGDDAFYGCSALASVTLPEDIKVIANWFHSCKFTSITIPASVTSINSSAFYTIPLDEIIMLSTTPPLLGLNVFGLNNVFDPTSISVTIKVPAKSLNAYKTASGWSSYASNIIANN